MTTPTATGTVDFDAKAGKPVQTWYQVYGDLKSGVTPVVALHGGPGSTHHYLLPLIDLATLHSIPVIFYDQIGNGNSTHLPEKSGDAAGFWTEQLFLDELDNLLRHLGIQDNYALLGQSWGGMLAARHASKQPKGLKRLVISESPASIALFEKAAKEELIAGLPADVGVRAADLPLRLVLTSYSGRMFYSSIRRPARPIRQSTRPHLQSSTRSTCAGLKPGPPSSCKASCGCRRTPRSTLLCPCLPLTACTGMLTTVQLRAV